MSERELEAFYETWSGKAPEAIKYDIEASVRKADIITSEIPFEYLSGIRSALDFGCGYGAFLGRFHERLHEFIDTAVGVDFSNVAIEVANKNVTQKSLRYYKLPYLNASENSGFLHDILPQGVDAILLIDLLEHVPNCKVLIATLSEFTRFFIIKLPIESSVLDNYFLPKEYPDSAHSNGHLREFDANNVHYFVRELGLTPIYETLYIYHIDDTFPPLPSGVGIKQRFMRLLLRWIKLVFARVLPKKIFLRVVGGGGYICLATFDSDHVLNP